MNLNEIKQTQIIKLALLLTIGAALIGSFVWYDNRVGFRDAGNFANLLAAIFSTIATIWLVATVVGQSQELRLQREELALQRIETARLAGVAENQARSQRLTAELATKASIRESVRLLVSVNDQEIWNNYKSLQKVAAIKLRPDLVDNLMQQRGGSIFFDERGCAINHLYGEGKEKVEILSWDQSMLSWTPSGTSWRGLHALAEEARIAGLAPWWLHTLAYSTPPAKIERTNAVQTMLTAAALWKP